MFTIPGVVSLPALTGVGTFAIDWPAIGVVLAWMLVAALVGSALGALQSSASKPVEKRAGTLHRLCYKRDTAVDADGSHREAA